MSPSAARTTRRVTTRLVLCCLVAAALAAIVNAAATTLSIDAATLGAGDAPVRSCDTDGVTVSYRISGGDVTHVTLEDIHPECGGGRVWLALTDDSGSAIGQSGPQIITSTEEEMELSPQPRASDVDGVHVVLLGR